MADLSKRKLELTEREGCPSVGALEHVLRAFGLEDAVETSRSSFGVVIEVIDEAALEARDG